MNYQVTFKNINENTVDINKSGKSSEAVQLLEIQLVEELAAAEARELEDVYKKNEPCNFFILSSLKYKNRLSFLAFAKYSVSEFLSAMLLTFIPTLLTLAWTQYYAQAQINLMPLGMGQVLLRDPTLALLIALSVAATSYSMYSLVPGATGDPMLIIEQFFLECICESSTKMQPEIRNFYETSSAYILFFGKGWLGIGSALLGAWTGVKYAVYAIPSSNPSFNLLTTNDDMSSDDVRVIFMEAVAYFAFVVIFNFSVRVGPHGHKPLTSCGLPRSDLSMITAYRFISVLYLSIATGSNLNIMRAWATAITYNPGASRSSFNYFSGQAIGLFLGFLFSLRCFHCPRYLYKAASCEVKKL